MTDLAKNLIDAYDVCEVAPLQGKDLDRFYLPLVDMSAN
jgi:hypothetical protein